MKNLIEALIMKNTLGFSNPTLAHKNNNSYDRIQENGRIIIQLREML